MFQVTKQLQRKFRDQRAKHSPAFLDAVFCQLQKSSLSLSELQQDLRHFRGTKLDSYEFCVLIQQIFQTQPRQSAPTPEEIFVTIFEASRTLLHPSLLPAFRMLGLKASDGVLSEACRIIRKDEQARKQRQAQPEWLQKLRGTFQAEPESVLSYSAHACLRFYMMSAVLESEKLPLLDRFVDFCFFDVKSRQMPATTVSDISRMLQWLLLRQEETSSRVAVIEALCFACLPAVEMSLKKLSFLIIHQGLEVHYLSVAERHMLPPEMPEGVQKLLIASSELTDILHFAKQLQALSIPAKEWRRCGRSESVRQSLRHGFIRNAEDIYQLLESSVSGSAKGRQSSRF